MDEIGKFYTLWKFDACFASLIVPLNMRGVWRGRAGGGVPFISQSTQIKAFWQVIRLGKCHWFDKYETNTEHLETLILPSNVQIATKSISYHKAPNKGILASYQTCKMALVSWRWKIFRQQFCIKNTWIATKSISDHKTPCKWILARNTRNKAKSL